MDTVQVLSHPTQDPPPRHYETMPVRGKVMPVTKASPDNTMIGQQALCALTDRRFITNLKFLLIIQRVIVGRRIEIPDKDKEMLHLGHLQMLYLASRKNIRLQTNCRSPTLQEWLEVESKIIALEKYLTPALFTYVEINHLSGKILEKVGLWLLAVSMSVFVAALLLDHWYVPLLLACFTIWAAATGALGSTAFLYVNALSIQVDPKVDLTSRTLVTMRLILGALFAVILAVPFGYQSFYKFGHDSLISNQSMQMSDSLLLLLPFTLGFSTPLALAILGRLVQGVTTFFGLRGLEPQLSGTAPASRRISREAS